MVKAATLHTGRTYEADALVVFGQMASLQLAAAQTERLNGVTLATDDEKAVRKALDDTQKGAEAAAAVSGLFANIEAKRLLHRMYFGGGGGGGAR